MRHVDCACPGGVQVGYSKIVFFDEPTTGLDPASRKRVHAILEGAKRNRAVVLTVLVCPKRAVPCPHPPHPPRPIHPPTNNTD